MSMERGGTQERNREQLKYGVMLRYITRTLRVIDRFRTVPNTDPIAGNHSDRLQSEKVNDS